MPTAQRGSSSTWNSRLIDQMARGLSDWGSIDLFGVTVAGAAWRSGRISDAHVRQWTRSRDRWLRRLAFVSTVPLNSIARGGSGDTRRTLAVCRALVDDRDDMVVKALSWALRELSKRDPQAVADFVRREEAHLAARGAARGACEARDRSKDGNAETTSVGGAGMTRANGRSPSVH